MNELIVKFSSVFDQEGWGCPEILDMSQFEGTNCFCSEEAFAALGKALECYGAGGLAWIDTGDYHYVSALRMKMINEPFSLLLLDNHPDDQHSVLECGVMSCGNWVDWSRKNLPLMHYPPGDGLPLFISIDLDILSEEYAATDWNQGNWSLDELFEVVSSAVARSGRLIGVDVCGGLTLEKGAKGSDFEKNSNTRIKIRDFLQNNHFFV